MNNHFVLCFSFHSRTSFLWTQAMGAEDLDLGLKTSTLSSVSAMPGLCLGYAWASMAHSRDHAAGLDGVEDLDAGVVSATCSHAPSPRAVAQQRSGKMSRTAFLSPSTLVQTAARD